MRAYSQDLRDRVINLFNSGKRGSEIAKTLKLCIDTVYEWIRRYKRTGDYSSKQTTWPGRARRFDNKKAILEFISKNPDADGITIRDAVAPELPMSTFYDTMHRMNITYKKSQNTKRDESQIEKSFLQHLKQLILII